MAINQHLARTFTPNELEFVASLESVEIVPLFRMQPMRTIAGMIGPFNPPNKAEVPVWIACELKKRRKCRIVGPSWMSVEFLENLLRQEITQPGFSALPLRYMEISKLLLDVASDDIPSSDKVRSLLKDLREARQAKSHQGLEALNAHHIEMTGIGAYELNEVRPFFTLAMKRLVELSPDEEEEVMERDNYNDDSY